MNSNFQAKERRVFYRFEEIDQTLNIGEIEILTTDRDSDPNAGVSPNYVDVSDGFWRRQFGSNVTRPQRVFDWIMGVLLPVVCFFFDPIVFKTAEQNGNPLLHNFKWFAYTLAIISLFAMMGWLFFGGKLKWLNGMFAGLFFAGGLISMAVGIVLFPFSMIGMAFLIGFLGFTPFFSSIIY